MLLTPLKDSEINEYNAQFYLSSCQSSSSLFINTDCPCFLINIIDSHIAVCGGLIMKKPVVSWLTPLIPFTSTISLCKLLKSLQVGFAEMSEYYNSENSRKLTIPLPYLTRLETINGAISWKYRYSIKSNNVMYKAILAKRPVIVKFVQKYAIEAHKCMAAVGFAPALLHFAQITRDWKVVIMEDLSDWIHESNYKHKLREAVTYLHSHGYVHGDMRADNILFNSNGDVKACDWIELCFLLN